VHGRFPDPSTSGVLDGGGGGGGGNGGGGGGGGEGGQVPFDGPGEYLQIVNMDCVDSEKTSRLTAILHNEDPDSLFVRMFREKGLWAGEGNTACFQGSPDWHALRDALQADASGRQPPRASSRGGGSQLPATRWPDRSRMTWHLPFICVSIGKTQVAPKVICMYRFACVCKDFQTKLCFIQDGGGGNGGGGGGGGGNGGGGGGGGEGGQVPFDGPGEYLQIVNMDCVDSEKTSRLTAILHNEDPDSAVVRIFREKGLWAGEGSTARFQGSPDWPALKNALQADASRDDVERRGMEDVIAELQAHRADFLPRLPGMWGAKYRATWGLYRWLLHPGNIHTPASLYRLWTTPSPGACFCYLFSAAPRLLSFCFSRSITFLK